MGFESEDLGPEQVDYGQGDAKSLKRSLGRRWNAWRCEKACFV